MKKKICVFRKGRLTVNNLIAKAKMVQTKLAAPQYANVVPTPADVAGIITMLESLQLQCELRNYEHKLLRDEYRTMLENALSNQCKCVNGLSNGDVDTMINSGFDMSKTPEQRPEPTQAANVTVVSLSEGQALLNCDHVPGAEWSQAKFTGPNGFRKWSTSPYPKFKVSDLPMGVTLNAYVRAVNYRGQGEWSAPVSFVAQVSPFSGSSEE